MFIQGHTHKKLPNPLWHFSLGHSQQCQSPLLCSNSMAYAFRLGQKADIEHGVEFLCHLDNAPNPSKSYKSREWMWDKSSVIGTNAKYQHTEKAHTFTCTCRSCSRFINVHVHSPFNHSPAKTSNSAKQMRQVIFNSVPWSTPILVSSQSVC